MVVRDGERSFSKMAWTLFHNLVGPAIRGSSYSYMKSVISKLPFIYNTIGRA